MYDASHQCLGIWDPQCKDPIFGQKSPENRKNIEKGITKVLYMSFDKFLLAVESHDLSQDDKSIMRASSFSI